MTYRVLRVGNLVHSHAQFTLYRVEYEWRYECKRAEITIHTLPSAVTSLTHSFSLACL